MALIKPLPPIAAIRGKLHKLDNVYFTIRYGKQLGIRIRPWMHAPTPNQSRHYQRVRKCNQMVQTILRDPEQKQHYFLRWQAYESQQVHNPWQKSYRRLRDFIYAQIYPSITSES